MSDVNGKTNAASNVSEESDKDLDDNLMLYLSGVFQEMHVKDIKVEATQQLEGGKLLKLDVPQPKELSDDDEFYEEEAPDSRLKSERKTYSRGNELGKSSSFYGHDDRVYLEYDDDASSVVVSEISERFDESFAKGGRSMKKLWSCKAEVDKWSHDLYVEEDQMPKTKQELIDTYGYDIRMQKSAPEVKRRTIIVYNNSRKHDEDEQRTSSYTPVQVNKSKRFSEQRNRSLPEWIGNK